MFNIEGPLVTAGLVAVIGAIVQVYSLLQDRRKTRNADARDAAREPLTRQGLELGVINQATVIQQRMIDSQGEQIQQLTLKVATLTAENALLRNQMMDMYIQMRAMEVRTGPINHIPPPPAD